MPRGAPTAASRRGRDLPPNLIRSPFERCCPQDRAEAENQVGVSARSEQPGAGPLVVAPYGERFVGNEVAQSGGGGGQVDRTGQLDPESSLRKS